MATTAQGSNKQAQFSHFDYERLEVNLTLKIYIFHDFQKNYLKLFWFLEAIGGLQGRIWASGC